MTWHHRIITHSAYWCHTVILRATLQMFVRAYHTFIEHEQITERKSYEETLSDKGHWNNFSLSHTHTHTHTHTQHYNVSVEYVCVCVSERDKCGLAQWWLNWQSRTLHKWMWMNHNNNTKTNCCLKRMADNSSFNLNQKCSHKLSELLNSEINFNQSIQSCNQINCMICW